MSSRADNRKPLTCPRILLYTSFTPYIVTFLHCIGSSDPADLALLQKVVATLESIASIINGCMRQYELCKALHRTAEAFVESRIMDMGRKEPQLERALNLSLQNPLLEEYDWSCFQTTLDGWNGQSLNTGSFTLGSNLDSHIN